MPNMLRVLTASIGRGLCVCVCVWMHGCVCREPGRNERVTLGGAAEALFAFRQRGIQEQVSVGQHGQHRFLWTLGHLHMCSRVEEIR